MSGHTSEPKSGVKAPDGGWGWVVVISSFIIHFIMDGVTYSLGTYLPIFTEFFNVSHGAASVVHALLPAITLGSGPIASMFTNRWGCRMTTIVGALIAALGFVIAYVAHELLAIKSIISLYITIGLIVGFGFGLVYVPAIVAVGFYFDKKRSFAIGIAVCGTGAGTFLLSPFNRILIDNYGWEGAFLIKAAIILNIIVCGIVMRPVEENASKKKPQQDNDPEKTGVPLIAQPDEKGENAEAQAMATVLASSNLDVMAHARSAQSLSKEKKSCLETVFGSFDIKLFTNTVFLVFSVSNFLTSLGFNAPFIYIIDQAIKQGHDANKADWLLSTIGISNTFGRIILGFIGDKIGAKRVLLYGGVLTICGIATIVEPFLPSYWGLLSYAIVFGITSGGYVSLTSIIIVDLLGLENLTNGFGIVLVFQGVATAIGPPTVGILYDIFKTYELPFAFTGTMIMLSGVMCFIIPRLQRRQKK